MEGIMTVYYKLIFIIFGIAGAEYEYFGCKNSSKTLPILPGVGWDSLQEKSMFQVLKMNYSLCKTTSDGLFSIPDQIFAVTMNKRTVSSQFLEDWRNYKSSIAKFFSMDTDPALLSVSYTDNFRYIKHQQVTNHFLGLFLELRDLHYVLYIEPGAEINPILKTLLLNAANALRANDSAMTDYILERIVSDYGTHYITSIDIGGLLTKEDLLYLGDKQLNRTRTLTIGLAATEFLKTLRIDSYELDTRLLMVNLTNRGLPLYRDLLRNSSVFTIGGAPLNGDKSLEKWLNSVPDHLAGIDYRGVPIYTLITTTAFMPSVPLVILSELQSKLQQIVSKYYMLNTHKGCTETKDPSFDYAANVDDGSCTGPLRRHLLGGLYQICIIVFAQSENFCQTMNLEKVNPLTGNDSCPEGYFPLLLSRKTVDQKIYNSKYCEFVCTRPDSEQKRHFCNSDCFVVYRNKVFYLTYWCAPTTEADLHSGYLFGDIYSSSIDNAITKNKSCPTNFTELLLGIETRVCVSDHYEMDHQYSVPFGGFFACSAGNPAAQDSDSFSISGPFPQKCPEGFIQKKATKTDTCDVYYCTGIRKLYVLPPLVRPPFDNQSDFEFERMVNESSTSKVWTNKNWHLRNLNDSNPNQLLNMTIIGELPSVEEIFDHQSNEKVQIQNNMTLGKSEILETSSKETTEDCQNEEMEFSKNKTKCNSRKNETNIDNENTDITDAINSNTENISKITDNANGSEETVNENNLNKTIETNQTYQKEKTDFIISICVVGIVFAAACVGGYYFWKKKKTVSNDKHIVLAPL